MKKIFLFLFVASLFSMTSCGDGKTYVTIETPYGEMTAELYNSTPIHKENFIKLVKDNYYDSLLFHRVIDGFMIQGGDPNSKNAAPGQPLGMGGPGYLLDAEIGAPHFRGTLAAARTGGPGNPEKKSSGSQFYIVHGKQVSDAELDNMERMKGFQYNETQRQKYKEVGGTPQLDGDYTVFGELVSGFEVLDQIAKVNKDQRDRPTADVVMKIKMGK